MNRVIAIIIFASIALIVYGLLNSYVVIRIASFLGFERSGIIYGIAIATTLSLILAMLIERNFPNVLSKWIYVAAVTWMGILFITFSLLLITEIINLGLTVPKPITGYIILALALIISVFSIINAQTVHVKKVDIVVTGIDKEMKFVQLSDIHLGTVHGKGFLEKVVSKTNSLTPQAVFITGDLFDGSAPIDEKTIKALDDFVFPAYFVTGNHEVYEGIENVTKVLKNTKLKWIQDEQINFGDISILGINYEERKGYLGEKLSGMKINKSKPVILLYHSPSLDLKTLKENNISLQLAGHTHAGQIFPFNFLVRLAFKYVSGLHSIRDNSSHVYVSSGTGNWGPPMRLGSSNEITLITLKPSK